MSISSVINNQNSMVVILGTHLNFEASDFVKKTKRCSYLFFHSSVFKLLIVLIQ